jgi:hypothetical protein
MIILSDTDKEPTTATLIITPPLALSPGSRLGVREFTALVGEGGAVAVVPHETPAETRFEINKCAS